MEFMPRITRAQSMDILSSQANLAGYKAVIDAAEAYGRAFPMMMTAAGTISAARALRDGRGRRRACRPSRRPDGSARWCRATDVRLATKEQILSLGGKPIFVEDEETKAAETAGGYAKEMSDAYKAKQAALVCETIAKQDIVITTALIPGRPAPRLVTAAQVATMKPGSVIVDLAVEQGGNVEGSVSRAKPSSPTAASPSSATATIPAASRPTPSALFARNLLTFVTTFWDKEAKTLVLPEDDEIVKAIRVTSGGAVVHPALTA